MDYIKEINKLKKEKNAIILAHNYQLPEIQDIADFIGDSLELSRKSAELENETIVFCGVKFMAETAKILAPEKTVLLPVSSAGCEMADMANVNNLLNLKKENPDAAVVSYVNTTAEIKSYSDICCTSANAVKIVNSVKENKIIFVPDKNLASYVARFTEKEIIPYQGYCYVHNQFSLMDIDIARKMHPNAVLFVHPEAPYDVADKADFVLSTGGMIRKAKEIDNKEIIIGTEQEMIYRLQKEYPDKIFYPLRNAPPAICYNMKKTHIEDVYNALKNNEYKIEIEEDIIEKAYTAISRMLQNS